MRRSIVAKTAEKFHTIFQVSPPSERNVAHLQFFLGYVGFVPGIKSENVFGATYGKTSLASAAGTFPRGYDDPVEQKYSTIMKANFVNHSQETHKSVADICGVQRGPEVYNTVSFSI